VHPAPLLPAGRLLQLAALVGGVITAPVAGTAALAAWAAKPSVVLGRSAAPCLTRPLRVGADALAELGVALVQRRRAVVARRATAPAPAPPLDELFDPALTSCPWCGSSELVPRLDTTDLMQHKPGQFHLDECRACGHVFQNPALSIQGLNYYYDQFYDGVSAEALEGSFANLRGSNEARIETLARFHEPRAWLDVGAGIGQFCVMARLRWPEARFDGLDLSDTVEEAQRRGWVDTAYRGLFPELAGGLPRSYDVVSMHHYLEHTRDPRAELSAAAKVLEPGGYLMVEVPDTASPWSRRLGRFWNCWFQPQHQHFVTCDNLVAALPELGFEVLSVERGAASTGADLVIAPMLAANSVAPNPNLPWVPESSAVDRVKRLAAGSVGVVTSALLMPVEAAKEAYLHGPGADKPSNAFRVVARRR
jgi:SAM-dependent methyltransferase